MAAAQIAPQAPSPRPDASDLTINRTGTLTELKLAPGAPLRQTVRTVAHARLIDLTGSRVRLVCWDEVDPAAQTTPYYAISLDGLTAAAVRPTSYVLRLRQQEFDPLMQADASEADRTRSPRSTSFNS